jgi:hypothetical protein
MSTPHQNTAPRWQQPKLASVAIPAIVKSALAERGFHQQDIILHWASIVGASLAKHTLPQKIVFPHNQRENGCLHLETASVFALDIQHAEPQIVDKINTFFGYNAVTRLKLLHVPLSKFALAVPAPKR